MNVKRIFLVDRDGTAAVLHGEGEPWDVTSHGRKDEEEEDERVPASTRRFGFAASSAILSFLSLSSSFLLLFRGAECVHARTGIASAREI